MKKSEIQAMNRSFGILEERRAKILDDERTIQLKERVNTIRENSINHMEELVEKARDRKERDELADKKFEEFVKIVERLRRECPWDREQTNDSIKDATLEEIWNGANYIRFRENMISRK